MKYCILYSYIFDSQEIYLTGKQSSFFVALKLYKKITNRNIFTYFWAGPNIEKRRKRKSSLHQIGFEPGSLGFISVCFTTRAAPLLWKEEPFSSVCLSIYSVFDNFKFTEDFSISEFVSVISERGRNFSESQRRKLIRVCRFKKMILCLSKLRPRWSLSQLRFP